MFFTVADAWALFAALSASAIMRQLHAPGKAPPCAGMTQSDVRAGGNGPEMGVFQLGPLSGQRRDLLLSFAAGEGFVLQRHVEENSAGRPSYPEFLSGLFFFLTGLALSGAALLRLRAPLFFYLGALLLIPAAGFLAAFLTAAARRRGAPSRKHAARRSARTLHPLLERARDYGESLWLALRNIDWRGDWLAVLTVLAVSLMALFVLWEGWHRTALPPTPLFDQLTVGVLLLAAFPLLVLERKYAGLLDLPEAPALNRLCRVPLLGFLALALAAGLRWLGLSFSTLIEHGVVLLAALVAIELCLRSLVYIFVPLPPLATRRSPADSFIAGLIWPQLPNLSAVSASVRRQFGIDLARSWAINFIRRAAVPVLLGMALFTWLLTGVTALGTNGRAVYEAFGQPQGVLHPGLHVHWPWPFGLLRPVEFGRVRAIAIEFAPDGAPPAQIAAEARGGAGQIESEPPPTADRLWDASHPEEASYLVASFANGRQGFEVVDIDMSVLYRIGLSDAAAEQTVYNIASPDALVRATTGQILAGYFARHTITDILGQNREVFIRSFQMELQRRLANLSSGIDVMGVVVEGIHPPPKAAAAYQGVQAAGIEASVKVATAAAEAAREMKMAQLVANTTRNEAMGAAAERINQAKADFTLFDGDRQAYGVGGESFLFERRLDRLDKGLADKPLIIVDHRIPASAAPTVNMLPARAGAGGNLTPSDD
jgi:regulator of protease activity HflC (stomatin/prohibitin superfamily)